MALDLYQSSSTFIANPYAIYCAGGSPSTDNFAAAGVSDQTTSTAGASTLHNVTGSGSNVRIAVMELRPPSGYTWDGGTFPVRFRVTTANMNFTLNDIYVCRVNSSGVSQATMGSRTGLGSTVLQSTGDKSFDVTLTAQTPAAGDKIMVVFGVSSGAMGDATWQSRPGDVTDSRLTLPFEVESGPPAQSANTTSGKSALRAAACTVSLITSIAAGAARMAVEAPAPTVVFDQVVEAGAARTALRAPAPSVNSRYTVDTSRAASVLRAIAPSVALRFNLDTTAARSVIRADATTVASKYTLDASAARTAILAPPATPTLSGGTQSAETTGARTAVRASAPSVLAVFSIDAVSGRTATYAPATSVASRFSLDTGSARTVSYAPATSALLAGGPQSVDTAAGRSVLRAPATTAESAGGPQSASATEARTASYAPAPSVSGMLEIATNAPRTALHAPAPSSVALRFEVTAQGARTAILAPAPGIGGKLSFTTGHAVSVIRAGVTETAGGELPYVLVYPLAASIGSSALSVSVADVRLLAVVESGGLTAAVTAAYLDVDVPVHALTVEVE